MGLIRLYFNAIQRCSTKYLASFLKKIQKYIIARSVWSSRRRVICRFFVCRRNKTKFLNCTPINKDKAPSVSIASRLFGSITIDYHLLSEMDRAIQVLRGKSIHKLWVGTDRTNPIVSSHRAGFLHSCTMNLGRIGKEF